MMTPTRIFAVGTGAWADFDHPRAVLFVSVTLDDDAIGWDVNLTGYVIERLDREPLSVSDRHWFETRREAAERATEIVLEVGAMADRAAAGVLVAA